MRGTRYGDFSRLGLDPGKDYSGLLLQQGRVQLDADFNARGELAERALRTALSDLFGPSAAPAAAPGFGIWARLGLEFTGRQRLLLAETFDRDRHTLELWLSWYGGAGVLVDCRDRNRERTTTGYTIEIEDGGTVRLVLEGEGLTARRGLRSRERLPTRVPVLLTLVIGDDYAALYFDSRQVMRDAYRGIHLEAPRIVLGGPIDGSGEGFVGLISEARVWRAARTLPQIAASALAPPSPDEEPRLHSLLAFDEGAGSALTDSVSGSTTQVQHAGQPRWRLLDLVIEPGRLYVDGVACEQLEYRSYGEQGTGALPTDGVHLVYLEAWEESISAVQDPSLREVALGGLDTSVATRIATRVRLRPLDILVDGDEERAVQATADELALAPTGRLAAEHTGDHAPGNYLYRVEIHAGGRVGGGTLPTFKWSRDNGASLFALAGAQTGESVIDVVPSGGGIEPLVPGDVVEPLAAAAALDDRGHMLARVVRVTDAGGQVELDLPLETDSAYLRRWQPGPGTERRESAELRARTDWIELEDGIRVRFEPGDYRRGDYWWIVSRLDLRSIEWHHHGGHPVARPPDGVERLTAPLALLSLENDEVRVQDLRTIVTAIVAERPPFGGRPDPVDEPGDDFEVIVVEEDEQDAEEPAPEFDDEPPPDPEPRWRALTALELPGERLQGLVSAGGTLVVATERELIGISVESGETRSLGLLPTRRWGLALCAIGELLLLIGGGEEPEHVDGHVYALELGTGEWSARAKLPSRRLDPAVVVADRHVHAIGGRRDGALRHGVDGAHHVYHPEDDRWTEAASLPTHRSGAVAEAFGDYLHVVGGLGAGRPARVHTEHEHYDRREDRWHQAAPLPEPGVVLGSTAHAGRHFVLADDPRRSEPQRAHAYDADADEWASVPSLPERLRHPLVAGHRERVYVIGERADNTRVLYEFG